MEITVSKPYKRSIFIVDPNFQLKFSALMCVVILVLSSFYPLVIYQSLSSIADKFPTSSDSIFKMKDELQKLLILWQIFFGLIVFVICVLFTHKVAGPLYKMKKYIINLRTGRFEGKLFFRGGDYFSDLANEVNSTVVTFQEHFKEDAVFINESCSYLKNLRQTVPDDKKIVINEIVRRLEEIEDRFEEFIG